MEESSVSSIDFEQWSALAKNDPEAFEARRQEMIGEFLSQLSGTRQERLKCLQWRIDVERSRVPNPMAACIKINQMMWDAFSGEQGLKVTINHFISGKQLEGSKAKVLSIATKTR